MGCTSSSAVKEDASPEMQDLAKSRRIDQTLKEGAKEQKDVTKLLLLGTGESGKTTILRQARRLYGVPFTQEERIDFKDSVWGGCLYSLRVVLEVLPTLGLELADEASLQARDIVFVEVPITERPTSELIHAIAFLWQQPAVRSAVEMRSKYQLNDSAEYFFDAVERIGAPDYLPTDEDLLRVRVRTLGIQETILTVRNRKMHFIDVGGQRSERRKWINVFEDIQVLCFVAAISEYDQTLREDRSVNRVVEAEMLFDQMVNSRYFRKTQIIIFFNKIDLLSKKLERVSLHQHFPEYPADDDLNFKKASTYLATRFLSLSKSDKHIWRHFTCSVDSTQIHRVLKDVIEAQLLTHFETAGLVL